MRVWTIKLIGFFCCLFIFSLISPLAIASVQPLSADKAFVFSAEIKDSKTILANWEIAPDYYLYYDRFSFTFDPAIAAKPHFPHAKEKIMADGDHAFVYGGKLSIPLTLQANQNQFRMTVKYQGCSQGGFCYPPITKTFDINLQTASIASVNNKNSLQQNLVGLDDEAASVSEQAASVSEQTGIQSLLYSQSLGMSLILFVGIGLLLAFTPCVLPMVPILTGIIVGQQETINTRKAFFLSLSYVLGSALMYAAAGLIATMMGSLLQIYLQKPIVIAAASVFFVLLSLSLFGFYNLTVPQAFHNHIVFLSNKQKGGKYIGVFLMGVLSTLIISPCVTAPLVGILLYISQTKDVVYGACALFALGLGMGLPLLLIGTSAGKWLPKTGSWMEAIKKACGFAMIAMAIWLSARIMPPTLSSLLWAFLLFGVALFLAFYLPRLIGKRILNKSLGFIAAASGVTILLAALGVSTPLFNAKDVHAGQTNFTVVRTIGDIDNELRLARQSNQPVLLDFYADWCQSCIIMDKTVFASAKVKPSLSRYKLLRVDLTNITSADEKIMKKFAVIAPPTVLVFDGEGKELNAKRIVGEVNASEFISRIDTK